MRSALGPLNRQGGVATLLLRVASAPLPSCVVAALNFRRQWPVSPSGFWAIFLVARHKKSISALQIQADLWLGSYRPAWLLLHKIRSCFDESPDYPLAGLVEVDEAYVGGTEKGVMHGRAAGKKGIVITGVEVLPTGKLGSARMKVIPGVKPESLVPFVVENVSPDATAATDGWPDFNEIERIGYCRERHVSKGPQNGTFHPVLDGVYLLISNLKAWLRGRLGHGVSRKYLPAYVAEFMCRFNRRRSPPDIFGWVTRRLMGRTSLTLAALEGTADVYAYAQNPLSVGPGIFPSFLRVLLPDLPIVVTEGQNAAKGPHTSRTGVS